MMDALTIGLVIYLGLGVALITIPTVLSYISDKESPFGSLVLAILGAIFWPLVIIFAYKAVDKLRNNTPVLVDKTVMGDYEIKVEGGINLETRKKYYRVYVTGPDKITKNLGMGNTHQEAYLDGLAYVVTKMLEDEGYDVGDIEVDYAD